MMSEFCDVNLSDRSSVRLFDEQVYSLTVNGRNLVSAALLPNMLEEFAVGYLITEGFASYEDIESVMVDKNTISVLTVNPFKVLLPKRSIISGCGGTASYLDPAKLPVLEDSYRISLSALHQNFSAEIEIAGGFSAAAVFSDGNTVMTSCLSLYSAFDKTIGAAGKKSAEYAVVCSGKVTADLVRKCLNAKVPVLASYKPATALAVKMAEKGNLTIVKLPEEIIYTHKIRVL